MNKKLCDLSNEELEKLKLIGEIRNNKRIWKQPAFWTFIVVLVTAGIGFYTGFFQAQKELIELKNEKLNLRKDSLSKQVVSLENEYINLQQNYDSIYIVAYNLKSEQDSIKKAYAIWKEKNQSKHELKKEVEDFVIKIRELASSYNEESMLVSNERWYTSEKELTKSEKDSLWDLHTNKIMSCSRKYMNIYNSKYKTSAILYKEKLSEYLLDYKSNYDYFYYGNPVNMLGVVSIIDDLEQMSFRLK